MHIDYKSWNRDAGKYVLISKDLLAYGREAKLNKKGRYIVDNDLINVRISNEEEDEGGKIIDLSFKATLNNDIDYLFSIEFSINELLPFINPLLLNQKNDLDIVSGKSYDKDEISIIFNDHGILDIGKKVNLCEYGTYEENGPQNIIIFLPLEE